MSILNIKELRQKRKISQPKLAELTGLSAAYICELERGKKSNPSIETLTLIANALKVPVTKLLRKAS